MIEKETNKKNWFKENIYVIGILTFAFIIRIYYFVLTYNQPVWWDSAEYLNIAYRFAFHTSYIFGPVRQVFFSFIISLFYHFSTSELLPRLFMLIMSMFSVWGMYLLGKEVFNKRIGLISAFLMSVFYLNLFFSFRLLVDLPSLTFFIFSAYFFYKYINTKKNSNLYWFALMIGIGTLFKLSTAFILVACLVFLISTEGFKFLRKKEFYISGFIYCLTLLPYIIFGYKEFGGFVLTMAAGHVAPDSYFNGFNLMFGYIKLFPTYFSWIFLSLFILGLLFSFYKPILYFNKLKEHRVLKSLLYVFLILVIPFILVSFFVNHIENRYIITCFSLVILLGSFMLDIIYITIKKYSKYIAIGIVIILLGFFFVHQIQMADSLIKNKLHSYEEIKEAGLWLKDYSAVYGTGIIATKSQPQIKYYSGLDTINLPPTEEEFINWTKEYNPQYFMLSVFEVHPDWAYTSPERHNLTAIQAYFNENKQPLLVICELK